VRELDPYRIGSIRIRIDVERGQTGIDRREDRGSRFEAALAAAAAGRPRDGYNRRVPMRILLSNDDGYFAPGLEQLAAALASRAEVTVVAPEADRSGASNSLTLDRPLTVRRAPSGFLFVNGTPTDCVHLAVTGSSIICRTS
jgi:hypothetical protein